jgi:tetratricopeptide (TPR) repeat protein
METRDLTKTSVPVIGEDWSASEVCVAARDLENAGDYEGAKMALAGLWSGLDERPQTEGLSMGERADVLLRVGALGGWLGSSEQIPNAQGFAKDLISESLRAFEESGNQERVAEAQTDLAICYWREGAMDEARVWFQQALGNAGSPENKLRVLVNSTLVEISANRFDEALMRLDQAGQLLDLVADVAARGRYHMQRGIVFLGLGGAENLDRALMENTAASVHFEQANHRRYFARIENNIGYIFLRLRRYSEALEHLDRARRAFVEIGDVGAVAQVNETRARVFIAQGRFVEAEKVAASAVAVLEGGDEHSLLAEALGTQGTALARMGRHQSALGVFRLAADTTERAGDLEAAGRTYLTMIEELKHLLPTGVMVELYENADRRLGNQLDAEAVSRLRECARLVLTRRSETAKDLPTGGSLEQEVLLYEGSIIRRALDEAKGSVTRAARILGITHQGLCYIINTRHRSLMNARAPVRIRRKSIIKKGHARRKTASAQA